MDDFALPMGATKKQSCGDSEKTASGGHCTEQESHGSREW